MSGKRVCNLAVPLLYHLSHFILGSHPVYPWITRVVVHNHRSIVLSFSRFNWRWERIHIDLIQRWNLSCSSLDREALPIILGKLWQSCKQDIARDSQIFGVSGILFLPYIQMSLECFHTCNVPSFYAIIHSQLLPIPMLTYLLFFHWKKFEYSRIEANDLELSIHLLLTA
jgi:hypothetical protein